MLGVEPSLINPANAMHPALFTPATMGTEKLITLMHGGNDLVRRLVICTEDAVAERDVPTALEQLASVLAGYEPAPVTGVFVRVRNEEVAKQVVAMPGAEKLEGIVVPKADPDTYPRYAETIGQIGLSIIPILETPGMNDPAYRHDLLEVLSTPEHRSRIDCVELGGNDLMNHHGMRRPREHLTIYDTIIGTLIDNIVLEFRGSGGFLVTAPVFECYGKEYDPLFRTEAEQSIANQLFGQIVIHPRHLPILHRLYQVTHEEQELAASILESDAPAVSSTNSTMVEPATHSGWARSILMRAQTFGIRSETEDQP